MLKTYDGISDLNSSVGHPMQVEDYGELEAGLCGPADRRAHPRLTTEQIVLIVDAGKSTPHL